MAAVVSHASQTNRIWREGSKLPQISRKRKKKPPLGTTFSFSLNEQASVTFSFSQRVSGRRVDRRCVAKTRRNRKRKACTRTATAGTLSFDGHSGSNKVVFQGRISGSQRLTPGAYTLVITATNTAGQSSASQKLIFTIVR